MDFTERSNFPWLISNVIDNETGRPLADGLVTYILEKKGIKFGLIGLVEEEWLSTLATIDVEEVTYTDYVTIGKKLAKHLKEEDKVDYVIALTHMRMPNDRRLAEMVDDIDIILGGHDHVYAVNKINNKYLIKSGSDFRMFSKITLFFNGKCKDVKVLVEQKNVTSDLPEDPGLKEALVKFYDVMSGKMDEVLGEFGVDLDGRFSKVRTAETNLGNFVCDIMLSATHSDVALLNSGTLRSDRIHRKGPFTMRDLVTILPMMDALMVISVPGEKLYLALENGVSQYPKLEGRFPQVGGLRFAFAPTKPSGQRVDAHFIKIGDDYLDFKQMYRVVTKAYLFQGKDGYECLKNCEILLTEDETPELCTIVQNHFHAIKILTGAVSHRTKHRQSLLSVSRRHSAVRILDNSFKPRCDLPRGASFDSLHSRSHQNFLTVDEVEQTQCRLEPRIEGRILKLTDELRKVLETERERDELACHLLSCQAISELEESSTCDKI